MDKKKTAPDGGGGTMVGMTLKGVALVKLVEAGVIQRNADGSVDTTGFERFWQGFERNLQTCIHNELSALMKQSGSEQGEDGGGCRAGNGTEKHADNRDRGSEHTVFPLFPTFKFPLRFLLSFALGILAALFFVAR